MMGFLCRQVIGSGTLRGQQFLVLLHCITEKNQVQWCEFARLVTSQWLAYMGTKVLSTDI